MVVETHQILIYREKMITPLSNGWRFFFACAAEFFQKKKRKKRKRITRGWISGCKLFDLKIFFTSLSVRKEY
jgi:hypothetical protein